MGTLGSLISWAVFGLVIGVIARFFYPGRQPMGWLATMVLGIVGSFVGGLISWVFGFHPEEGAFRGGGWIMSIIGAIIVVWGGLHLASRSARRRRGRRRRDAWQRRTDRGRGWACGGRPSRGRAASRKAASASSPPA
jgi:uncharacterized membrane protein YeaQ/YmgE (transglycosylase-associated protein family)